MDYGIHGGFPLTVKQALYLSEMLGKALAKRSIFSLLEAREAKIMAGALWKAHYVLIQPQAVIKAERCFLSPSMTILSAVRSREAISIEAPFTHLCRDIIFIAIFVQEFYSAYITIPRMDGRSHRSRIPPIPLHLLGKMNMENCISPIITLAKFTRSAMARSSTRVLGLVESLSKILNFARV